MNHPFPQINLLATWVCLVLGFASGSLLGLFFHREEWLGGYASLRRRLYRLGHIAFFGLGIVNFCFYLTARAVGLTGVPAQIASLTFVVGAITMPICCGLMAHFPKTKLLFGIPVLSLLTGGIITAFLVARADVAGPTGQNLFTSFQP